MHAYTVYVFTVLMCIYPYTMQLCPMTKIVPNFACKSRTIRHTEANVSCLDRVFVYLHSVGNEAPSVYASLKKPNKTYRTTAMSIMLGGPEGSPSVCYVRHRHVSHQMRVIHAHPNEEVCMNRTHASFEKRSNNRNST